MISSSGFYTRCFFRIRRAANQNETAITIAAFHKSAFVYLQPDFGMAHRSGNIAAAIAGYARIANTDCFGYVAHAAAISKAASLSQSGNRYGY